MSTHIEHHLMIGILIPNEQLNTLKEYVEYTDLEMQSLNPMKNSDYVLGKKVHYLDGEESVASYNAITVSEFLNLVSEVKLEILELNNPSWLDIPVKLFFITTLC
jgi:hypothetical protein